VCWPAIPVTRELCSTDVPESAIACRVRPQHDHIVTHDNSCNLHRAHQKSVREEKHFVRNNRTVPHPKYFLPARRMLALSNLAVISLRGTNALLTLTGGTVQPWRPRSLTILIQLAAALSVVHVCVQCVYIHKQTNSVALSPRANYTDWSTATCRRNLVPTFVGRGVSRGQRGGSPTIVNLSFLDRSLYFFFQVTPHLSSQGLSGPRSRLTATQKIW
jgi:hypothetical protein